MLTVPEQFLLLTLDSHAGEFTKLEEEYSKAGFAGAALMELSQINRIDCDVDRLWVDNATVTGDASLDPVLSAMARPGFPDGIEHAIAQLVPLGEAVREAALQNLFTRNVLVQTEHKSFFRKAKASFELQDGKDIAEMKARIHDILTGRTLPDPRDICIMALAKTSGLVERLVDQADMAAAMERLEAFTKTELIGQSIRRYLYLFERDMAG